MIGVCWTFGLAAPYADVVMVVTMGVRGVGGGLVFASPVHLGWIEAVDEYTAVMVM